MQKVPVKDPEERRELSRIDRRKLRKVGLQSARNAPRQRDLSRSSCVRAAAPFRFIVNICPRSSGMLYLGCPGKRKYREIDEGLPGNLIRATRRGPAGRCANVGDLSGSFVRQISQEKLRRGHAESDRERGGREGGRGEGGEREGEQRQRGRDGDSAGASSFSRRRQRPRPAGGEEEPGRRGGKEEEEEEGNFAGTFRCSERRFRGAKGDWI